jgi:hypothetical protein
LEQEDESELPTEEPARKIEGAELGEEKLLSKEGENPLLPRDRRGS